MRETVVWHRPDGVRRPGKAEPALIRHFLVTMYNTLMIYSGERIRWCEWIWGAQIGVLLGNDLRIYQLGWRPAEDA